MRLAIINTGGTISCVGKPLAPMTSAEFANASQRLLNPIVAQEFPDLELDYITDLVFPATGLGTLDSTNLQPTDWCVVAERILVDYQDYDGWVILHGTDSMAHSASAFPFLLNAFDRNGNPTGALSKPVILTGSQSPLFSQDSPEDPLTLRFSTDAFQNVCAAIAYAQRGIPEVAVAFRGHLWRGTRVLKTNADMDEAFSSPNLPPLGSYGINLHVNNALLLPGPAHPAISLDNPLVQDLMLNRLRFIAENISDTVVMPFKAFPAAFGAGEESAQAVIANLLRAILATGVKGLVLDSYGSGNFPSGATGDEVGPIEAVIAQATSEGVVVVNCTQVLSGTVNSSIYAAGAWLAQAGAISPGDMTPICAFSKTTVLLAERGWGGNDWEAGTVRSLISQSLLGERAKTDRLDVGTGFWLHPGQSLIAIDGSAELSVSTDGVHLRDAAGSLLWKPELPAGTLFPVHLQIRSRGVVLVDRSGDEVWCAAVPAGSLAQRLSLRGSHGNGDLILGLFAADSSLLLSLHQD